MNSPSGVADFELQTLLCGLVRNISHQQYRLDMDYRKSLLAFAYILELAKTLGYEQLAREIAPQEMVINKVEVKLNLRFVHRHGQEFALRVRPLGVAYQRKYAYSEFVSNEINLVVVRNSPPTKQSPQR